MRIKQFTLLILLISLIGVFNASSQEKFVPKKVKTITCSINTKNVSGSGAGVFAIKEKKVKGDVVKNLYDDLDLKFKVTLIKKKEPKVSFKGKPDVRVFHFDLDNPNHVFLDLLYHTGFNKEAYDKLNQLLDSPVGTEMEIEFNANISDDDFNINKPQTIYLYLVEIGERIDFDAFDVSLKKFISAYLKSDIPALAELVNFPFYSIFKGEYPEELTLENGSTVPNTKAGFLKGGFQEALALDENKKHNASAFTDKKYNYFPKMEGKTVGSEIVFKRSKKDDLTIHYHIQLEHNENYDISLHYWISAYEFDENGRQITLYFKKVGNSYKFNGLSFGLF